MSIERLKSAWMGFVIAFLWPALSWAGESHEDMTGQGGMDHAGMEHAGMEHGDMAAGAMEGMTHVQTASGETIMVMEGIPLWLFLVGVVGLIVVSFVGVEWFGAPKFKDFRFNLIKNKRVYDVVKSRWFRATAQLVAVAVLVFLVYAGLFGNRHDNITPVAVWTIWWGGLIFAVLLLGSAFCFVCPWDGLANLVSRLRIAARVDTLSLKLPFPGWLETVYPAIALFVVLTWLELGQGVTSNPRTTAYMGIGMAAMAVVAALMWDKKKFCKHFCPVGRICGMYGNFSPVEIRPRNLHVCSRCDTHACLNGSDDGYPCPTDILLKETDDNSYCLMCTECVSSCTYRNVAINIRPFGTDLNAIKKPRLDEAWLVVALLTLTLFHGLSMTSAWESFEPGGQSLLKWLNATLGTTGALNFTVAMALACAVPVGLFWLSCRLGAWWAGDSKVSWRQLFKEYSFSLLPVALFYHLAHNAMHLFEEGTHIIPMLSDPLGTGADYLGTAGMEVGALLADGPLWALQIGLIMVGHIAGIVFAHRIGHRLYPDKSAAVRSLVPMLIMMVLISAAGLGLMHLDMNMRVGRM